MRSAGRSRKSQRQAGRGIEHLPATRRIALVFIVAAIAVVAAAAFLLLSGGSSPGPKRAVIVDQLSLTQPNSGFVSRVTDTLSGAGYAVDYFHGEEVTVELYRTLPKLDYDLVILRVHAGITEEIDASSGQTTPTEYVSLFTGEPYDEAKYSASERVGHLGKATYNSDPDGEALFAIGPRFIEESMTGTFDGAMLIMMGCDGLRSQRTGQAFLNKGASAFVSWSGQVSAPHTDAATETLLQHLIVENKPVEIAVNETAREVGRDPAYGAELRLLSNAN